MEHMRPMAAPMEEPLRLMVELQGDSLYAPPRPAQTPVQESLKAAFEAMQAGNEAQPTAHHLATCSGCKGTNTMLHRCSGCKQARYCRCVRARVVLVPAPLGCMLAPTLCLTTSPRSRACQKKHWPKHKAECQAAQQSG